MCIRGPSLLMLRRFREVGASVGFTHPSPFEGHLGCLHLGAVMNKAVNIKYRFLHECKSSLLWGECPSVCFLGRTVVAWLEF